MLDSFTISSMVLVDSLVFLTKKYLKRGIFLFLCFNLNDIIIIIIISLQYHLRVCGNDEQEW